MLGIPSLVLSEEERGWTLWLAKAVGVACRSGSPPPVVHPPQSLSVSSTGRFGTCTGFKQPCWECNLHVHTLIQWVLQCWGLGPEHTSLTAFVVSGG